MNTLQKAERVLIDAKSQLLNLAEEMGPRDPAVCMRLVSISQEISKAVHLMFASDGAEGNTPPTLELH